jgi:hypothetical protein
VTKYCFQSTTNENSHNHFSKLTEELSLFFPEKSALFIASENFEMMFCLNAPSKGYSVQAESVILKYHIKFFLPESVSGEY